MKKFLLFSLAVLLTGTTVAQTLDKRNAPAKPRTQTVVKSEMKSMANKPMKAGVSQYVKNNMQPVKMTSLKAMHQATPNRVGVLQASYQGRGVNYDTHEAAAWTMKSGVEKSDSGRVNVLIDVIPIPEDWKSLGEISVPYKQNGNTITIEPQCVVSGQTEKGETLYYFIHSWTSNNGAIVLTLGDDGSLTTIDGEDIAYSAFSENVFDLTKGGPYVGYYLDIEKVKYYMEGQTIAPVAGYEPTSLFLHPNVNVNGNYYTNLLMPAYADITLENRTDMDCTSYDWSVQPVKYDSATKEYVADGDPINGKDKDFTFPVTAGSFSPATLVATLDGVSSEPYQWNKATWYAGGAADDWEDESSPTCTFTKAGTSGDLTYLNPKGCSGMIFYQGKPASPLFFTGVNILLYSYEQVDSTGLKMTAKICKAHRDAEGFSLGEVIATSDCETEVETGSWIATRVNFSNFYVEDEFGMTTDLDYLLLDEEFAIVIEGWDNGSFKGYPLAMTAPYEGGTSSTFAIITGEDTYTGHGWSFTGNCLVGFIDATYGYLHTESATDLVIPAEGGKVTIDNIEPMFITYDENENVTTSLWIDNEDAPEWVDVTVANEVYTEEEGHFDLAFEAEALPEGVSGRYGEFVFVQRGAMLKVTVAQGDITGVNSVAAVKVANGKTYDVNGRQVNGKKGLVIRDGKKFIVK